MSSTVETRVPRSSAVISNETFGVLLFLISDTMFFAGLASTYTVLRVGSAQWRPPELPSLVSGLAVSNTVLLFASAASVFLATRAIRREDPIGLRLHLSFSIVLGLTFLAIQIRESMRLLKIVPMDGNLFGSVFYTYVGLHGVHVLGGLIFLGVVLWNALRGKYHRYRATPVLLASYYWYFVVLVWVFIFLGLYVF
jgi:cytochrome c oxidase subunit 3